MNGADQCRSWPAALAAYAGAVLFGILCFATAALGADQSDSSFGQNGVARVPLPQKAALAEAGIWDLASTPDGKMFASLAGESYPGYFGAARLNEDGSLDRIFGNEGFTAAFEVPPLGEVHELPPELEPRQKTQAQGVAVQADGKSVVAGYLEVEYHNHSRLYAPVLARYGTTGLLDPSFGQGGVVAPRAHNEVGSFVLHAVAVTPSGRIIAVGAAGEDRYGYNRKNLLIAYTPDGKIDHSFGYGGTVGFPQLPTRRVLSATTLTAVRVLHSGKILVGGYLFGRLLLARLTAKGKLDPTFGGGDGKVSLQIGPPIHCCGEWASLALQSDGKILLAGKVSGPKRFRLGLARFRPNGTLDRSFGEGGLVPKRTTARISNPRDVAVQGDGRIVVVGSGHGVSEGEPQELAFRALRYLPNGKIDQSFGEGGLQLLNPAPQNAAFASITQADGRVVAGGALARLTGGHYETELLLSRYLSG